MAKKKNNSFEQPEEEIFNEERFDYSYTETEEEKVKEEPRVEIKSNKKEHIVKLIRPDFVYLSNGGPSLVKLPRVENKDLKVGDKVFL